MVEGDKSQSQTLHIQKLNSQKLNTGKKKMNKSRFKERRGIPKIPYSYDGKILFKL